MTQRPDTEAALVIEIDDTGIGMTAEEMSGLFQPFYRVRHRASRGTAAGPGWAWRFAALARQLGGDVAVRSIPSVGSTFTLTVPVGVPAPAEVAQTQPPGKPQSGPVIASDRCAGSALARPYLAGGGSRRQPAGDHAAPEQHRCRGRAGANGKEALERVRDAAEQGRPFDAVIMDMEMPVLDGYEAVRQLRAGGFTAPSLPSPPTR